VHLPLFARRRRDPVTCTNCGVKLERVERELSRNFDLCTCTTRGELDNFVAAQEKEAGGKLDVDVGMHTPQSTPPSTNGVSPSSNGWTSNPMPTLTTRPP